MAIVITTPDIDTDDTTTALAGLDSTLGLVEQTAVDTFTKRAIGVGASTSVPTRADADGRYLRGAFATYAAMTASTPIDNAVYATYARATEEDGGFGFWRYDSGSSATANGGTILAIDGGGAGRFFRLYDDEGTLEWFGGGTGISNNATAFNSYMSAVAAGTTPKNLRLRAGAYNFTAAPTAITTSVKIIGSGPGLTAVVRNYTPSGADDPFLKCTYSYVSWEGLDISPGDGTSNGRLLEIILDSSPVVLGNWQSYESVRFVGNVVGGSATGTCKVEIYLDGDDSSGAPSAPGLRDISFHNCWAGFVGGTNSLYAKTVRQLSWVGGYLLNAVTLTGGGTYNSANVLLQPIAGGTLTCDKTDYLAITGNWTGGTIASTVTSANINISAGTPWTISSTTTNYTDQSKAQHVTIELGAASDTTLTRSTAGLAAIEGNIIPHVAYAPTWLQTHIFNGSVLAAQMRPATNENIAFRSHLNLSDGARIQAENDAANALKGMELRASDVLLTTTNLKFYSGTPVAQHSSTGETTGFTAGAGTNVTDQSTFTGNVGSTAYRISDIVKALKNIGIMAS